LAAEPTLPTGREVERAEREARTSTDLEIVESAPPAPFVAPDPKAIGVSRRQFFNRGIVGMMGLSIAGFGGASLAFLWPQGVSGFGSKIKVGNFNEVLAGIKANNGFLYKPEGRMWLTAYPNGAVEKARATYSAAELNGMTAGVDHGFESGVVAIYQKCPHLGCRVPNCVPSQWFECPCHGSQYNQVGEKKGGPAPRGMDRFAVSVVEGVLTVDTGTIVQGPPIGTNTTGQESEGPHCIGQAEH
jgi:cytochrome b6-f complex iron-sulfur subunit